MPDDETFTHPQDNDRYTKTLDAIVAAPESSIRAVLFSLYAEGNAELKSLIEDRVLDFIAVANLPTLQNLNIASTSSTSSTTDSSEDESGMDSLKTKAADQLEGEPEKELSFCINCEEEFDPEDEDDDGCYFHPGESSRPNFLVAVRKSPKSCPTLTSLAAMSN